MAFAAIANGTAGSSSTANQTGQSFSPNQTYNAGSLMIYLIAVDNSQTTDGDEGAVSAVSDNAGGNTWVKGAEFTNGQGSARAGVTISLWYCVLATQITTSTTIQCTFTNTANRDKSCWSLKGFTIGAGSTVAIEGTPGTLANDGADPGSLDVTTSNIECLRMRAIAAESNNANVLNPLTTNWTNFFNGTTSGGGSAANVALRGEFRISTGTSDPSNPTLYAADCASVYVALREVAGTPPAVKTLAALGVG